MHLSLKFSFLIINFQATITGDEHVINVKYSIAKVASDYIKRKHVLRLMLLNGTEYLVQTESHASMMEWLKALQIFTREISEVKMKILLKRIFAI